MKTLVVLNDYFINNLYAIIEGDFAHIHGVILNSGIYSNLANEAKLLLFSDKGRLKHYFCDDIKLVEDKNWDKIAVINFEN